MDETAKPASGEQRATTKGHRDARAEALQKALRDNLRRRKAALATPETENPPSPERPDTPDENTA